MTHRNASADMLTPERPDAADRLAQLRLRLDPPRAAGEAEPSEGAAAVLAPLLVRDGALHVILTLRPRDLPRHPGQVCFPGGRIHAGEDAAEAALRETYEEIGVEPFRVDLLGRWERTRTLGGLSVTPFAGLVDPAATPRPCPREVAEMFAAPLDLLLDARSYKDETVQTSAGPRRTPAVRYDGHLIWGATAAMLRALAARLDG